MPRRAAIVQGHVAQGHQQLLLNTPFPAGGATQGCHRPGVRGSGAPTARPGSRSCRTCRSATRSATGYALLSAPGPPGTAELKFKVLLK